MTILPLDPPELTSNQAHLRILETTDLHLQILPYDYFTDSAQPGTGLAQAAQSIRALRQEAGLCVLLDNGDFLQGTPLSDWVAEDSGFGPGDLHPMIGAMNALGYDGGTLGNHDFNYGLDFLRDALAQATFPVVSANITTAQGVTPAQDTTLRPAWTVLTRQIRTGDGAEHGLRIGVIGFAPPQTKGWEKFSVGSAFDTRDIIDAAQAHVPLLRAAGADVVIALAHTGIDSDIRLHGMENAAVPLAAVAGIDAVLAGHTHQVFPGPDIPATAHVDPVRGTLHGKPAVMAASSGSHIGVIDMVLERGPGGWRVARHSSALHAIGCQDSSDAAIVSAVQPAHRKVVGLMREHIGSTDAALHSHLALVGYSTALNVLGDAMGRRTRDALAGTPYADWPLAVAIAPSRSGGQGGPDNYVDIPAGPLARRHAAELYHYPNKLCVLALTGAQVRCWLEWAARLFHTITPGAQDQALHNPRMPGYNVDALHGLHYRIDPSQPAATGPHSGDGQRIGGLCLADGTPLCANDRILLATNTYRASGGGGYGVARPDQIVHTCGKGLREVVQHYMQGASLSPDPHPNWTFAPLPGTSVWFDSSPKALARMPPGLASRIEPTALQPSGFQRYRLHL